MRDKNNKLFLLTLNKISSEYRLSVSSPVNIREIAIPDLDDLKTRLLTEYYNFLDVFNRSKIDNLSPYRIYNYRLKFNNGIN